MANERSILIVDSDRAFRQTVARQLKLKGAYSVDQASSIAEAVGLLDKVQFRYDALILDVALSDGDGRDSCADQRRQGHRIPIIMLTELGEEADVVRGLDAGANDYVTGPVRISELLARLRARMRIFENSGDAVFKIGSYTFHPSEKLLQEVGGKRHTRLTVKEAKMLKFLHLLGGKLASRQVLLNEVWDTMTLFKQTRMRRVFTGCVKKLSQTPQASVSSWLKMVATV